MFALEMTVRVLATVAIGMLFIHMHGLLMERFRHQLTRWEPWTAGVFLGMAAVFAMLIVGEQLDGLGWLGMGLIFVCLIILFKVEDQPETESKMLPSTEI